MKFLMKLSLVIAFICAINSTSYAQKLTAKRVRGSLRSGVRFLKDRQEANGSWAVFESYRGGKTALCTLALLHAGVSPKDPAIVKSLRNIAALDDNDRFTYSVSLQIMVLCMADSKKYRPQIAELVTWLEKAQSTGGPREGGWPYSVNRKQIDNSNSQFALLALHEAARAGVEIDDRVWERSLNYWKKEQDKRTGAFGYVKQESISGTMVCAGISSLIIAQENYLATTGSFSKNVSCCGKSVHSEVNDQIALATAWMAKKFSVRRVPGPENSLGANYQFYYLYGLERAGRLAGVRFFGEHDWYREGAQYLIESQTINGSWKGKGTEVDPTMATAFALLFLSKGRRPIAIGKYKYGKGADWDRHRKGVHFLTRAIEQSWKRDLNWQTVNGNTATVNDLLESPVLFMSGKESLNLSAKQKTALRDYVNQGGFIFAEACDGDDCDGKAFDASFRKLMGELFPNSGLQPLAPDHPVWFADQPVTPNPSRPLLGLQACCRTSVIYCPKNLSCFWNFNQPNLKRKLPPKVLKEVNNTIQIGVNVVAYATNREFKSKLDRHKIDLNPTPLVLPRDQITIAKIQHAGGADDAPVALKNLLQSARTETKQPFAQRARLLDLTSEELKKHPFLFMHGRKKFSFTDEERAALKKSLLERRFFLFSDTICASDAYAASFRKEMKAIFPDHALKKIDPNHPLLTQKFSGFQLNSVTLHTPVRDQATGQQNIRTTKASPQLEVIEIDNRIVVVFSPLDLSCALENSGSAECKGYITEDATKIGINVLLYALQN